jgi:hypothetical protein
MATNINSNDKSPRTLTHKTREKKSRHRTLKIKVLRQPQNAGLSQLKGFQHLFLNSLTKTPCPVKLYSQIINSFKIVNHI